MRWCLLLLLVGCSSPVAMPASPDASTDAGADTSGPPPPTWADDIAPIVAEKCAACHVTGGMAPFPLTTYDEAFARHTSIAQAVRTRRMPPWLPDETCRPHVFPRLLAQPDIDRIVAWSQGGALQGRAKPAPKPTPKRELEWIDKSIDIGVDYVPSPPPNGIDDWRCFILDPNLAEDAMLLGYDLVPTVRTQVHHAGIVEAPLADAIAMDNANAGPGWSCFGGVNVGVGRVVATWAAGFGAVSYPKDTAMRLHAGTALVVQIHYHLADASTKPVPDRTTFQLQLAHGPVPTEIHYVGFMQAPTIPPHSLGHTLEMSSQISGRVWSTEAHMHLKGTKFHVEASNGGGCLLDIPRWDYHWEEMQFFEQPMMLPPNTTVSVKCTWDNPTDETIVNGFGIDAEMCAVGMLVSD